MEFNPWRFSGQEEMLAVFIGRIIQELNPRNAKIRKKLLKLLKVVKWFGWIRHISVRAGEIQNTLQNKIKAISAQPSIEKLKDQIDEIIMENDLRIFILIDDVDRLTPREQVEIFQIIKLNASFKNSIFIIAFDKEIVTQVLSNEYKVDGAQYLDKIIQVDYRIPDPLEEIISEIFFTSLKDILLALEVPYEEDKIKGIWVVNRLKYYFVTLRDIYRYFNALQIRLAAIKDEVNIYDFIVIEAIRVFDFKSYELIQRNFKQLIQFRPYEEGILEINKLIKNGTTLILFEYLFRKKSSSIENSINDPEYFDRYFALSINIGELDKITYEVFKINKEVRRHIFEKAVEDGRVQGLLSRILNDKIDDSVIYDLIQWKPSYESELGRNRILFLNVIHQLLKSSSDVAKSFSVLVDHLSIDDRDFNPAKYFLLSYFNNAIRNNGDFLFGGEIEIIKYHEAMINKRLCDLLSKYHSQNMIFYKSSFTTRFLHKLFLSDFNHYFSDKYIELMRSFLGDRRKVLDFLKLIVDESKSDLSFDQEIPNTILPKPILQDLVNSVTSIQPTGLSAEDLPYYNFFIKNLDGIAKLY